MTSSPNPPSPSQEPDFEQTLLDVERSLNDLKDRYAQVKRDQQRQQELEQRIHELEVEARRDRTAVLKTELRLLKRQLDEVEVTLESRLFSWKSMQEPFWQAVRFGGIGVILGWMLRSF